MEKIKIDRKIRSKIRVLMATRNSRNISDIARNSGMIWAYASKIVRELEAEGLIKVYKTSKTRSSVYLTEKGYLVYVILDRLKENTRWFQ